MIVPIIATLIQIVITITAISAFGFILALFSYFLDFCFYKGNIFGFWLPFLAKMITMKKYPLKYCQIEDMIISEDQKKSKYIHLVEDDQSPLYKMLGGCVICLNVWIGFITFPFIAVPLGISLWYYPVYILSASFFLRKITKIE